MKNKHICSFMALGVALFLGCTKTDDTASTPIVNPYGNDNGQITFWCSNSNSNVYPITVSVGGQYVGTIGGMLSTQPDCASSNNNVVKFVGSPGTYNTFSKAANGGSWSGTITIANGACYDQGLQ